MARIPDGFLFFVHDELKCEDGKVFVEFNLEEKQLVMCKHCRHWYGPDDGKEHSCDRDALLRPGNWFCAGGEEEEEQHERD